MCEAQECYKETVGASFDNLLAQQKKNSVEDPPRLDDLAVWIGGISQAEGN